MTAETKTIEEVTTRIIDYRGKTPPKTTSGIPLVTTKVIKSGRIQDMAREYIAEDYYDTWMRRGLPEQWDVLITTEAPLGEVAILKSVDKIALAQRVVLLRGNPELISKRYLCFALQSPYCQAELAARATGTTVLGIKQSELRQVRIPYYPLSTQESIAGILSAYDDLIENNLRRIAVLEQMARLVYEEWFVHFRFPGHGNFPITSEIPEGWTLSTLEVECDLVMGQSPKSEFYNQAGEGLPFHQGVTDFGTHFPKHRIFCSVANRIADHRDILFSVRAPVGRINVANERIVLGRGLSAIKHRAGFQCFTLYQLRHRFQKEDSIGGGTIFASVTQQDMHRIPFLRPTLDVTAAFEHICTRILDLIEAITHSISNLRVTRDFLLPRLVSGSVDVSTMQLGFAELEGMTL